MGDDLGFYASYVAENAQSYIRAANLFRAVYALD